MRRALSRRRPTNSRQQEPQNKQHLEEQQKTRPATKASQDTTTKPMTSKQNQDPQTKPTNESPNRAGIPMLDTLRLTEFRCGLGVFGEPNALHSPVEQ
jgi:hypothetical protein